MPQSAQAQQDDLEAAELELDRKRMLKLGFIFANVPTGLTHARAQGQGQGSQFRPDGSQSSQPSRPATTEPSYSQFSRPDLQDRSLSDPTLDNDLSGSIGFSDEGEDAYLRIEDDPSRQMIGMYSPNKHEWIDILATLDTGANGNWITEKSLKQLNIEAQPNSAKPWEMDNFGGKTIRSERQVKIQWTGPAGQKTYRTVFRVAGDSAPFEVILGKEFLFGEDVLTFNKSVLVFVKKARTEEEQRKIAERRAEQEAQNRELEEKRRQDKALKEYLAKKNRDQGSSSRSGGSSGRRN